MTSQGRRPTAFDEEAARRGVHLNVDFNKARRVDVAGSRDLSPMVMEKTGRPKIMPASFYRETTLSERLLLCQRNAIYCLPTVELIDWLRTFINGRRAIEIGAGNGAISAALRLRATDNRMQEHPDVIEKYASMGQPVISYGRQVEAIEANAAVRKYKPEVVVAAWVTHRFRPDRAAAGGNAFGVDEEDIIANCDAYVFVGNHGVHEGKSIWSLPHTIIEPDFLFSRSSSGKPDFIAVWERAKIWKDGRRDA